MRVDLTKTGGCQEEGGLACRKVLVQWQIMWSWRR
jgi:hypothetical protein